MLQTDTSPEKMKSFISTDYQTMSGSITPKNHKNTLESVFGPSPSLSSSSSATYLSVFKDKRKLRTSDQHDLSENLKRIRSNSKFDETKYTIVLSRWCLRCILAPGFKGEQLKTWILIEGFRQNSELGMKSKWHSSLIISRIDEHTLETFTGTIVQLHGDLDYEKMCKDGFSEKYVKDFKFGFPEDWSEATLGELLVREEKRDIRLMVTKLQKQALNESSDDGELEETDKLDLVAPASVDDIQADKLDLIVSLPIDDLEANLDLTAGPPIDDSGINSNMVVALSIENSKTVTNDVDSSPSDDSETNSNIPPVSDSKNNSIAAVAPKIFSDAIKCVGPEIPSDYASDIREAASSNVLISVVVDTAHSDFTNTTLLETSLDPPGIVEAKASSSDHSDDILHEAFSSDPINTVPEISYPEVTNNITPEPPRLVSPTTRRRKSSIYTPVDHLNRSKKTTRSGRRVKPPRAWWEVKNN
ncbi:hypothetical protein G9A89_017976 [Geosiphon pyriformis]|nr:hypothetical protein G9A89_017976 [Geosiphon pyriformis]